MTLSWQVITRLNRAMWIERRAHEITTAHQQNRDFDIDIDIDRSIAEEASEVVVLMNFLIRILLRLHGADDGLDGVYPKNSMGAIGGMDFLHGILQT